MASSRLKYAGLTWFSIVLLCIFPASVTSIHARHGDDLHPPRLPPECEIIEHKAVQCRNRDLHDVSVPLNINKLELYNVTGKFKFEKVHHLQWVESNIKDINAVIEDPSNLEYLDISYNKINNLQNYQFRKYKNLKFLNLSHNVIDDLPRYVFNNLSLEILSLSHNLLRAIPFQVFAPIERVKILDLSHNQLVTFLDHFFKFNRHIEELILNDNRIVKLTSNALADLVDLRKLDLSNNSLSFIAKGLFDSLKNLEYLSLANNPFSNIVSGSFRGLQNLFYLNLSGNKMKQLTYGMFHFSQKIRILILDDTRLEIIRDTELLGLPDLEILSIRKNVYLREIETYVFADTPKLLRLDISGNGLTFLPLTLANLTHLIYLNVSDNPWACDCRMFWFANWAEQRKMNVTLSDLSCGPHAYPNDMIPTLQHLNCTSPSLQYKTPTNQYRLKTNALLECRYSSYPPASITWITPMRQVYHWNPDPSIADVFHKHPHAHDMYMNPMRTIPPRIQVLDNGTLYIQNVTREDCGRYICYASNPVGNFTADVLLHIDPVDWNNIRILSLIVGAQCAAIFLGMTLLVQFLRYILNR